MRIRHPVLIVVIICTLLFTGLSVSALAQDQTIPRYEPSSCPFDVPPGFTMECGKLTVPEDHYDPANTNTLSIFVAQWKATGDTRRPDPIVVVAGGPGFSNTIFPQMMGAFPGLLQERDFIGIDARGVAHSQPALTCPAYADFIRESLGADWDAEDFAARRNGVLGACLQGYEKTGVNLQVYDRAQIAADIEALRVALNYEQINLLSFSYGNFVAQQMLTDFGAEGHIRAVVMDSPTASQGDFDVALGMQRALDAVFGACKADGACDSAYPNLPSVFEEVVQKLDAEPVMMKAPDYMRGGEIPLRVDGAFFASLIAVQLTDVNRAADIPKLIYAFRDGKMDLAPLVAADQIMGADVLMTIGMNVATRCRENILFSQSQVVPAALKGFIGRHLLSSGLKPVCARAGILTARADRFAPTHSEVPALLAVGELDPFALARPGAPTAADLAAEFAATLSNSTVIVVPGAGHTTTFSPHNGACVQAVALAFLNDPTAIPDASCLSAQSRLVS